MRQCLLLVIRELNSTIWAKHANIQNSNHYPREKNSKDTNSLTMMDGIGGCAKITKSMKIHNKVFRFFSPRKAHFRMAAILKVKTSTNFKVQIALFANKNVIVFFYFIFRCLADLWILKRISRIMVIIYNYNAPCKIKRTKKWATIHETYLHT